jgi:hypothetical protein
MRTAVAAAPLVECSVQASWMEELPRATAVRFVGAAGAAPWAAPWGALAIRLPEAPAPAAVVSSRGAAFGGSQTTELAAGGAPAAAGKAAASKAAGKAAASAAAVRHRRTPPSRTVPKHLVSRIIQLHPERRAEHRTPPARKRSLAGDSTGCSRGVAAPLESLPSRMPPPGGATAA